MGGGTEWRGGQLNGQQREDAKAAVECSHRILKHYLTDWTDDVDGFSGEKTAVLQHSRRVSAYSKKAV